MEDDEMREMERTVPGTLLVIGWISEESVRLIEVARSKLSALVKLLQSLVDPDDNRQMRNDIEVPIDGFVDPEPVGVDAPEILDNAIREVKARGTHHGKVSRILPLCIGHRRIDAAVATRWASHNSAARRSTNEALTSLRNAASYGRAAQDASYIAGTFERQSPPWSLWLATIQVLSNDASREAADAGRKVLNMRHHVRMEFFEAWIVLNCSRATVSTSRQ